MRISLCRSSVTELWCANHKQIVYKSQAEGDNQKTQQLYASKKSHSLGARMGIVSQGSQYAQCMAHSSMHTSKGGTHIPKYTAESKANGLASCHSVVRGRCSELFHNILAYHICGHIPGVHDTILTSRFSNTNYLSGLLTSLQTPILLQLQQDMSCRIDMVCRLLTHDAGDQGIIQDNRLAT